MLTDYERQEAVLLSVGDDGTVAPLMPGTVWPKAANMAARRGAAGAEWYADLQDAYARLLAIDVLLGSVRAQFSYSEKDRRVDLREKTKNLRDMRVEVLADIEQIVLLGEVQPGSQSDQLTTTAPVSPPAGWWGPDPNDPYYQGSPYTVWPRRGVVP